MPFKKNTPGCPCCTPTGCDVTFVITACCGPAVGASIVVKDGSGTTKGTGTTNSSGSVTINLAGTSGQTLYATVSYKPAEYEQYTGVLMGNHCGRTYAYTAIPIMETYGTPTCGQMVIQTVQCNGTTLLGGKAWTLLKGSAGGWTTYATGTTDATTAKSTITGLTYGGPNDYYMVRVTDATGTVDSSYIYLSTTNCSVTCVMRMATSISFPCNYPQDTITYNSGNGVIARRGCSNDCGVTTIPGRLFLTDPAAFLGSYQNYGGFILNKCGGSPVSATVPLVSFGSGLCGGTWTGQYVYYRPGSEGNPYFMSSMSYQLFLYPWNGGSSPVLTVSPYFKCTGGYAPLNIDPFWGCDCSPIDYGMVTIGPKPPPDPWMNWQASASSFTCSPFSATFSIPARTMQCYIGGLGGGPSGTRTYPARTITIHE